MARLYRFVAVFEGTHHGCAALLLGAQYTRQPFDSPFDPSKCPQLAGGLHSPVHTHRA